MKNKLVVLEGIDGVGKTTITKLLKTALLKRGIPVVLYENHERKAAGFNAIKPFVKHKTSVDASLFFYVASSIYKSAEIDKLLRKYWVICDRYIYSTFAYHRVRGADMSLVANPRKLPIRLPDFCFLIKAEEGIRMQRARYRKVRTPQDLMPKKKGNLVAEMERALEKFRPIIINNSNPDVQQTVRHMMKIIVKKKESA